MTKHVRRNDFRRNDFRRNGIRRNDHFPYGHASMLLFGEESEAYEPYNKYDKIRPHSIRSLQFDQKVRPLSFRPEKFDLFTATLCTVSSKKKRNVNENRFIVCPIIFWPIQYCDYGIVPRASFWPKVARGALSNLVREIKFRL